MLKIAKILSRLPFTVNVFGRKRDLIVRLGDALHNDNQLKKLKIDEKTVDFSGSEYFKIAAYATRNLYRDFERSDLGSYMKENLKEGGRFIDIGANLGGYSWLATNLGAQVDLFEPVSELNTVLQKNQHFFGRVHPVALSNERGEHRFYTSSANIGGSSLVESSSVENSGYDGSELVQLDTFDHIFHDEIEQGGVFDLIKIDVEGNELSTVEGMANALKNQCVKALWCEVRGPESDRNPNSCIRVTELMNSFGFQAFRYNPSGLTPFDYNSDECPKFFDLIYLPHE